MSGPRIVSVIGNPRPESRTHGLARALARELARAMASTATAEVDLSQIGPGVLDAADTAATSATGLTLRADLLVAASPTYKGTYTGLLKAFLDRLGNQALAGIAAVPVLLGALPDHRLAVDLHFAPLLLELGAAVPVRGLFVLEDEVPEFASFSAAWADAHAAMLLAASGARRCFSTDQTTPPTVTSRVK
jgi:FMN reductase